MALISKENFSIFQGSQMNCIDRTKCRDTSIELLWTESISQNTSKLSNKVGDTTTAEICSPKKNIAHLLKCVSESVGHDLALYVFSSAVNHQSKSHNTPSGQCFQFPYILFTYLS